MTHTMSTISQAIQESTAADSIITVESTLTIDATIDAIRDAWLVDADGKPMEASRSCDIDYSEQDDGSLDVWGWSSETASDAQDWRLRVELV